MLAKIEEIEVERNKLKAGAEEIKAGIEEIKAGIEGLEAERNKYTAGIKEIEVERNKLKAVIKEQEKLSYAAERSKLTPWQRLQNGYITLAQYDEIKYHERHPYGY
ncbi:hypothetical protein CKC_05705 [Candidatus Liberibacter solanacearum CLso-ZC1]|uniref:Uncharacterized protein n=1 Tax=Liberibacter solanacearum (strain CLso-ZC1) TaxID=658172 RepID=E4UE58_LIBSC|nr:hypothetical protein CKC_05705 [Candidatus Liberibacter solanacearum CLso-ZC1]